MVQVPRYTTPQVRQAALPGTSAPTNAPIEAFGGGQAVSNVFGQAAGLAQDQAQREYERLEKGRRQALDIAATADQNALYALRNDIELKRSQMKLSDAMGASEMVDKEWSKGVEERRKNIQDPDQLYLFDKAVSEQHAPLRARTDAWIAQETDKYDDLEFESWIDNFGKDAAQGNTADFSKLNEKIEGYLDRKDIRGEAGKKAFRTGVVSKIHTGVIASHLESENDLAAQAYFEKHKGELTREDFLRIKGAVEDGSRRGVADRIVEDALKAGYREKDKETGQREFEDTPTTFKDFMDRVRSKMEDLDPKTKRLVTDEAYRRWNEIEKAKDEAVATTFETAWNETYETGKLPTADVMRSLPVDRQERILGLYSRLARNEKLETNPRVLTEFMALSKEQLKALTPAVLFEKLGSDFSEEDYKNKVLPRWVAAREEKGQEKFSGYIRDDDMILSAFKKSGVSGITESDTLTTIGKDSDKALAFARFKSEADDRLLQAYHGNSNKNVGDDAKKTLLSGQALQWAKKVTKLSYPFGLERAGDERLIGEISQDEDLSSEIFRMDWRFRQGLHNMALGTGLVPQGTPIKDWEDKNRNRINHAYIASLKGASNEEIRAILTRP